MNTFGILGCMDYRTLFREVVSIEKWDLENGYKKPKPVYRAPPKKLYYPPKNEKGRYTPITGRGMAAYNLGKWR